MPKTIQISQSMQKIFDRFIPKIREQGFHPATPLNTLQSRLTATFLVNKNRSDFTDSDATAAKACIERTSTDPSDFQRLLELSNSIINWRNLEICSTYKTGSDVTLEYKFSFTTDKGDEVIHRHARFEITGNQCKFVDQAAPLIRIIGDSVLHRAGSAFPTDPSEQELLNLHQQIELAKTILIQTGGAGIAANQCAAISDPYRFTIVGVFQNDVRHVTNVSRRYPNVAFPDATIMINPRVDSNSDEMISFYHGCLSIPGRLRGEIKTPKTITVSYLTFNSVGTLVEEYKTMTGMSAVALRHELNHILEGKTYMDCCMSKLNRFDIHTLESLVRREIAAREHHNHFGVDLSATTDFYRVVSIDEKDTSTLNQEVLKTAVSEGITSDTLRGVRKQLRAYLANEISNTSDQMITDPNLMKSP